MWQSELDPVYIQANASIIREEEKKEHLPRSGNKESWYQGSVDYWDKQPATIDGVLGGYGSIHNVESDTSRTMINTYKDMLPSLNSALDCGAGIGRITKSVLKPIFENVDLVEPSAVQLNEARIYCSEGRNFYQQGLQEFCFPQKYDAIWIQWVLCYLTDDDIADFLVNAKERGLTRGGDSKSGLIFIKENTSEENKFHLDKE